MKHKIKIGRNLSGVAFAIWLVSLLFGIIFSELYPIGGCLSPAIASLCFLIITQIAGCTLYYGTGQDKIDKKTTEIKEKENSKKRNEQQKEKEEIAIIKFYEYIKKNKTKKFIYKITPLNPWLSGISFFVSIVYLIIWLWRLSIGNVSISGLYETIIPAIFLTTSVIEFTLRESNYSFKQRVLQIANTQEEAKTNKEIQDKYPGILSVNFDLLVEESNKEGEYSRIATNDSNLVSYYEFTKWILYLFWIAGGISLLIFFILPGIWISVINLLSNTMNLVILLLIIIIFILLKKKG